MKWACVRSPSAPDDLPSMSRLPNGGGQGITAGISEPDLDPDVLVERRHLSKDASLLRGAAKANFNRQPEDWQR